MADEELNPKMRFNPLWYQGWEFDDATIDLSNIQGDLDMKGHGIVNLKNPTKPSDAVSKDYVDKAVAGGGRPLVASQVASTETNQIQARTVQDAIDEISSEAAFIDATNTFQEVNIFNKPPKFAAGVQPTDPQDLVNLAKVNELLALIKASWVGVDQTTPLVNLPGANVQEALQQADDLFSELSELIVENTSLVGTYNAATNRVVEVFGGAAAGGVAAGQALPSPIDENKGMYVLVTVGGTGTAPAPTVAVQPGDIIVSNGTHWNKVATAVPITTLAASQVSITAIAGVNGANVQEALASLASKTVTASDVSVNAIPNLTGSNVQEALSSLASKAVTASNVSITAIPNLTGNNVQDALADAAGKIQTNATTGINLQNEITKVDAKISALKATQVGFDNTTAAIPGNAVDTVQKAIEGVVTKFSGPNAIEATKVSFASTAGITATNVAGALDELKTSADNLGNTYVTKTGGVLTGELNAGNNKITSLRTPDADTDAVNKKYVDDAGARYVTRSNGQLDTDLDANNKKIVKLANPTADTDAANQGYVKQQLGAYVAKDGGVLISALNASDQKITNLGNPDPTSDKDAVNVKYVKDTYLPKTNGVLGGDLNASDHKVINVAAPTGNKDAANKQYVDTKVGDYVLKDGGQLVSALNANNQQINNVADGAANGDAVNKGQLDAAIAGLSSQLTGKLTFIGTYNAQNNQIATLTSAAGAFSDYAVNQPLPTDKAAFANHFFIVTVAGTGTAPAPTTALNIGDLIYSSGSNWMALPLGTSRVAANVGITAIQQLPGVDNVQVALETLAAKPSGGASTADAVTVTPAGGITATNVQAALEGLDTSKANASDVVTLATNQTITGTKIINRPEFAPVGGSAFIIQRNANDPAYFQIKSGGSQHAYLGFGSSARKGAFQLINTTNIGSHPAFFEFNVVCRYDGDKAINHDNDLIPKKYANDNFVSRGNAAQDIDGDKSFLKPISIEGVEFDTSITGNRPPSRFDFLSDDLVKDAQGNVTGNNAPVRENLIEFRDRGAVTRVSGFTFNQTHSSNVARGSTHFVLKYYNADIETLWFRLSYRPGTSGVKCFVQGNKLSLIQSQGHGEPTQTNNGVILEGVANATADSHAVSRRFGDSRYVQTGNVNQVVGGIKTFGMKMRFGYGGNHAAISPEDNSAKTLYFRDSALGSNNKFHINLDRACELTNLVDPRRDYDAAHKKYVDDAVARAGGGGGIALEKLTDVNITASITSLSGKGTLTFSSRVMRDSATRDVISAMFGMKLTLTAPWNPGESTTPAILAGCQINGEEYFKGLPVPVDSTLQGGSFKTVAQIQLIRVVPTSGVNLPQADSPLQIGRIVCKIDGGNTKLYAVFKHNSDIAVPTGNGAFFVMRYEGLPTMSI